MKTKFRRILRICLIYIGLGMTVNNLEAVLQDADFDLAVGYRQDEITTLIRLYNPKDKFLGADSLRIKNISIGEVGLKASYLLCDSWYVKGYGSLGKVMDGKYRERVTDQLGSSFLSTASVYKGNTSDVLFGAGYLFTLRDCFGDIFRFGPLGGWSFHYQKVTMKNGKVGDESDPVLDGLSYKTHWQGPWIGVDAQVYFCEIVFKAGYEYHWADWHGKWLLDGPDIVNGAFSDRRKASRAYGQSVYLEGIWQLFSWFEAGLILKYQEWQAHHGREKPIADPASIGISPTEVDKIPHARWTSWGIGMSLGWFY